MTELAYKVGMVSLGCAKNQVNSEQMLWLLRDAGYDISVDLEDMDAIIVNTCGFIESAKTEAIENILEFAELKKEGRLKAIVVAGCLTQRYGDEVRAEIPEADAILGCGSFDDIVRAVDLALEGEFFSDFGDINAPVSETDRVVSSGPGWAYIKIAEGCDNRCSYCVIPSLRGVYRSRPMDKILSEASELAALGIKELIIVAQDTTRYGTDVAGEHMLPELLRKISEIEGIEWIRLHYLYPSDIDDALIREIAENSKIVKYLDIPIQHIDDKILGLMNRRGDSAHIEELFMTLREKIPGVVIRTSLISGLPGEGEAEFEALCEFLKRVKLERAGVFPYSPEEGTAAYEMPRPDRETAERRAELISALQFDIMERFNEERLGSVIKVLCEGYDRLAECYFGRSEYDSPEIDGKVFFTGKGAVPGEFCMVELSGIVDGDLIGEMLLED